MGDERARELDDELRLLRARAYGPGADIDSDPLAVARLGILEQQDMLEHLSLFEPQHGPAEHARAVLPGEERPAAPAAPDPATLDPTALDPTPAAEPLATTPGWRRRPWTVPLIGARRM